MIKIEEKDFYNFVIEYGLVPDDEWFKLPNIPVFFVYDKDVNQVIIDGQIPLILANEMFDKLAHFSPALFSNTLCGSRMDPIMISIDNWIRRDGLASNSLNDYAILCNVFLVLDDSEHYIDYTTIECLNVLKWFADCLLYLKQTKDEDMKLKGMY